MKSEDNDFEVAYRLHQQSNCFGLTENAILPKDRNKENYKPRTLIDQTLELIDPTPNIHTLFIQFNERFFWNVLLPVEVKWSTRMTSCAGTCTFHPRNRQCVIALSLPLLKLRPRKDLVETLLHEMIHGYLFLTNNDRDRDGHGPEFCKHMHRINKEAGTKITIYHSFHDEVKLYQQHWWRCNGPCQKKAPYFGTVRRAMNRAPGPTDFWWKEHQQTCGGQFIKIKEPENFKTKGSKKVKSGAKSNNSGGNMFNWLTKAPIISEPLSTSTPKSSLSNNQDLITQFKKLGNSTNNVHGWGTGGPINTINNSHKSNTPNTSSLSNTLKFCSSGVLGGSNTGRSNLLNKLYNNNQARDLNTATALSKKVVDTVNIHTISKQLNNNNKKSPPELQECPVCSTFVLSDEINEHVDICLTTKNENSDKLTTEIYNNTKSSSQVEENISFAKKRKNNTHSFSNKQPKLDELQNLRETNCPVCNRVFKIVDINEHLDNCLLDTVKQDNNLVTLNNKNDKNETTNISIITSINPSSITEDPKNSHFNSKFVENDVAKTTSHNCLVCNSFIPSEMSLRDHLEDCIGNVFKDDSSLSTDCDNETTSEISLSIPVDQSDKYPCPVCMQLISESFMNQHLDTCLQNT